MSLLLSGGFFSDLADSFYKTLIDESRWLLYLQGIGNTIAIALGAVVLGVLLGIIMALIKYLHKKYHVLKIGNAVCSAVITVLRGTPVVLQLMIMFFVILVSINRWGDGVVVAIVTFGINSSAYVAEIIRGGLESVDDGQLEAGKSLGLNVLQIMRLIILPQAVRRALPPLGNEFIALVKETSVVGYVGIVDLTRVASIIQSRTFEAFFPLIISAAVYLILVLLLTWLLKKVERRLARSDRS